MANVNGFAPVQKPTSIKVHGDRLSGSLAWTVLQAHASAIHALLLRLTLRPETAEDLMQDLFIKLAAADLKSARDPAAYVRRVAINLAMDWRRGNARRRGLATRSLDHDPLDPNPPPARIDDADDIERILDAAGALAPLERDAFILRYIQQESFERVGSIIGKTAHQSRGLCHAAVSRIRLKLNAPNARPQVST